MQDLYDFDQKITADNWDELSNRIRAAHQKPDYHLDILRNRCRYEAVVQDTYWNPGSDLGHPDLFKPNFRINRKTSEAPVVGEASEHAFGKHPQNLSNADKLVFGDYIFHKICEFAIEFDLPFQNHTGLGIISGSNPMNLEPVIARYPQIKFVLFHGGYPWCHEVGGLAVVYEVNY